MTWRESAATGAAHYAAGRYDEALAAFRAALALAPRNAGILHNLGVALAAAGHLDEAAERFRQAATLEPDAAAPWLALGHLEFGRRRPAAAETAFARAASLAPGSVEAHYNLGYTRTELGRWADALAPLENARALDATNEQVWYQLFNTRIALGEHEAALGEFLAFEPRAAATPFFLRAALDSVRRLGDPAREARYVHLALDHDYRPADAGALAGILARLQYFDVERAALLRLYQTYGRLIRQRIGGAGPTARQVRVPGKRLRIGYLSADFRQHVMGRLMFDVVGAHDRERFSVFLYSLAREPQMDPLALRFREVADGFADLAAHDDAAAARAIAADDCDVLVDLMGHTRHSRPEILAYKPARVIVTHLGYHGAIGLPQVDFKLTDRYADVADAAEYQIEKPLPMASCVLPFRRDAVGHAAPPARAMLGIAPETVVWGEFVTVQKLSPRSLALWRAILAEVPDSVLLFSPPTPADEPAFIRQLKGSGIDARHVRFVPRGDSDAAGRARYAIVDLVLDTMPYTGGETTMAALDAGIPVVTLAGTRHAERMGASILLHLGIDYLVAPTEADYVARAIALANDAALRSSIAGAVVEKFAAAAATYPVRYTRDLEAALLTAIAAGDAGATAGRS